MWGAVFRAAVYAVFAYFLSLIVERILGEALKLMKAAPSSSWQSKLVGATSALQDNFLLLLLLAIGVMLLARANLEGKLGGVR